MMKIIRPLLAIAALAALAAPVHAEDLADLLNKADMVHRGNSSAALFEMEIKTDSYERSYKVAMWDESNDKPRTLVKILGPALWRGFGTLKVGERLKLFDPKTNHITLVSSSMLGDNWMGSHFSNDDLVKETRLARDYRIKLVKKWNGRSSFGQDGTFYRLALSPKPRAPVAWGRIEYELWTNGKTAIPVEVQYYRKPQDQTPSRTMSLSNVREFGGRLVPAEVKVTVAKKPGEYTKVTYTTLKFGVEIPSSKFTDSALRQ